MNLFASGVFQPDVFVNLFVGVSKLLLPAICSFVVRACGFFALLCLAALVSLQLSVSDQPSLPDSTGKFL